MLTQKSRMKLGVMTSSEVRGLLVVLLLVVVFVVFVVVVVVGVDALEVY